MVKHDLINILKKLLRHEISGFKCFLNSPYHNRSRKIILLYEELIKFYPHFDHKKLTKEYILKKISASARYNDSTFRVLMYDLFQLLQKFLINESLKQKKSSYSLLLMKELYDRKYFDVLKAQIKKSEKTINKDGYDYNFFYDKYLLESYRYNIIQQTSPVLIKGSVPKQLGLLSGSEIYLTLFFATELISDYTNLIIYSAKYNVDYTDSFFRKILLNVDIGKLLSVFNENHEYYYVAMLYRLLYSLYSSPGSRKKYEDYRNFVKKCERQLSSDEISFHYSRLISCCILNQGSTKNLYYNDELFRLYVHFLDKEFYKDNKTNYLPANLFRAILLNAFSLKKYQWAKKFIEQYISKVHEKERENIYNWGYAFLYNEAGDNSKSIEFLDRVKVNYFIFKYDIYSIKLKVYFEYENPETVLNYIRTYKEFLRNDNFFSESRKIPYKNFVKSMEYLLRCQETKNTYYTQYLKNTFMKKNHVINKEWILEKISLIEKKIPAKK